MNSLMSSTIGQNVCLFLQVRVQKKIQIGEYKVEWQLFHQNNKIKLTTKCTICHHLKQASAT